MAKKSSTIYLEEMFWDMVTNYQNERNLSSRNDSLQLILQEWDILRKIDFNNIKINMIVSDNTTTVKNQKIELMEEQDKEKVEDKSQKIDHRITEGLFKIENSMKKE